MLRAQVSAGEDVHHGIPFTPTAADIGTSHCLQSQHPIRAPFHTPKYLATSPQQLRGNQGRSSGILASAWATVAFWEVSQGTHWTEGQKHEQGSTSQLGAHSRLPRLASRMPTHSSCAASAQQDPAGSTASSLPSRTIPLSPHRAFRLSAHRPNQCSTHLWEDDPRCV